MYLIGFIQLFLVPTKIVLSREAWWQDFPFLPPVHWLSLPGDEGEIMHQFIWNSSLAASPPPISFKSLLHNPSEWECYYFCWMNRERLWDVFLPLHLLLQTIIMCISSSHPPLFPSDRSCDFVLIGLESSLLRQTSLFIWRQPCNYLSDRARRSTCKAAKKYWLTSILWSPIHWNLKSCSALDFSLSLFQSFLALLSLSSTIPTFPLLWMGSAGRRQPHLSVPLPFHNEKGRLFNSPVSREKFFTIKRGEYSIAQRAERNFSRLKGGPIQQPRE